MTDHIKDNDGPVYCLNEDTNEACIYIRIPNGYSVYANTKDFLASCCTAKCTKVIDLKEENKRLKAKLTRLRTAVEKAMKED